MWSSAQRATNHALVGVVVAVLVQTFNTSGYALAYDSSFALASNMVASGFLVPNVGKVGTLADSHKIVNTSDQHPLRRLLAQANNFDGLNDVLKPAVLVLPKLDTIKVPFLLDDVRIDLSQLQCKDIRIGSVQVESSRSSSTSVELDLKVSTLHVSCTSNWKYQYLFFSGDGSVHLDGSQGQSSIQAKITLESNSDRGVPTKARMTSCKPGLDFEVSFKGGIVSDIANVFKDNVDDVLEDQFKDLLCYELDEMVKADLAVAILGLSDSIGLHTPCEPGQRQIILHDSATYRQCVLPQKLTVPDAISIEEALNPQVGQQEVLNLNTPMISLITSRLQSYLGGIANETLLTTTHEDLGINIAVRSLLGAKGALSLDMNVPLVTSTAVSEQPVKSLLLTKVIIEGLDSFEKFDMIAPISNWTLGYGFNMRQIKASIELQATLDASGSHNAPNGQELQIRDLSVKDAFNVTFGASGLGLDVAQLLAININSTRQLTLGQVLAAPLGCASESTITANISEMLITVADVLQPKVDGLVGVGVDSLVNGMVEAVYESYQAAALIALPNFVKTTGVDTINSFALNAFDENARNQSHVCPSPRPLPATPTFINFQQSQMFAQLANLLQKFVGQTSPMNKLVEIVTEGMNPGGVAGVIEVDKVLDIDGDLKEYGHIYLTMTRLRIAGLNTLSELSILQPTSDYSTLFSMAMGDASGRSNELRAQVSVDLRMEGGSLGNERNSFTFSTSLSLMSLFLDVLSKIDQGRFEALRLEQIVAPDCLLATFRNGGLAIKRAQLAVQGLRLGLACSECSNSYLRELSQTWNEQYSAEFQELSSLLLASISAYLEGSRFQSIINEQIADSTVQCATKVPPLAWTADESTLSKDQPSSESVPMAPSIQLTFGSAIFCLMAMVGTVLGCSCSTFRGSICRQKAKEARTIDESSLSKQGQRQALIFNGHIPFVARIMVVLLLLLALIMFVFGHLLLAVTVDVKVFLLGLDLSLNDIFALNVVKGIEMSWESDAYAIALALVLVSVLWPYIRIVSMIFLFCLPPALVPAKRRGCLLEWLDFLAKWSMFDIYTFVVLMLAINLKVSSPTQFQILPPQLYNAELLMSPQMGMTCNIIAQMIAQIAAHVEIHYHHRVLKIEKESSIADNKSAEPRAKEPSNPKLCEASQNNALDVEVGTVHSASVGSNLRSVCHSTLAPYIKDKHSLVMSIIAHAVVLGALMLGVMLMWLGTFLPALSITTTGLVGIVMDISAAGSRNSSYSLYQLAGDLFAFPAEDFTMQCGMFLLAIVFAVCTILVPLTQAVLGAVLWSRPLKRRNLERIKYISKVISCWSFFEVFLIAVFISTLQIEQLASGIAGSVGKEFGAESYKVIDEIIAFLQDIGIVSAPDAELLGISAELQSGAYVLITAAIILNCTGIFINNRVSICLMQNPRASKPLDGIQKLESAVPTAIV